MDLSSDALLFALVAIVSALTTACVYVAYSSQAVHPQFWGSHPWDGKEIQRFSRLRATLRSITESQSMIAEGYAKFSKFNIPFIHSSMALGPVVIIPPLQLRHILNKPEAEIDVYGPLKDILQMKYTIKDSDIYDNRFHFDVVRKHITKNLAIITDGLTEELALGFELEWGSSTKWKSIPAWDSIIKIVARGTNRVFVGLPLCRNEKFLEHSRKYSMSIFAAGTVINTFPASLRPIIGPIVGLAGIRHFNVCRKLCIPVIEARIRNNQRKLIEPDFQWEPPVDGLQWLIEDCAKKEDPKQLEPGHVAHRLLMLNMVSIHSTSFTITNTVLDLYNSSPDDGFIDGLREECNRVLTECGGTWTKDGVSRLIRTDSTIRESMRFSDFGIVALPRRVSAPEGIELDDNIRIPKGVRLGVPIHEIHHDDALYSHPSRFDAFRFSRPYDLNGPRYESTLMENPIDDQGGEKEKAHANVNNSMSVTPKGPEAPMRHTGKQQSVTTGGDTFLAFGYGRHPCPGRYFATHEMKLMLAHLVQHYDVEHMPKRPALKAIMETRLPSSTTSIRVRKRPLASI